MGCTSISSLILPVGVKTLGYEAFSGCSRLTRLAIPRALTEIEDMDAFFGCESLAEISFGGSELEWQLLTRGAPIRISHPDLTVHEPRVYILDIADKTGGKA